MRRHLRVIEPTTQNLFQVLWQVFLLGGSVQQTKQTCQQERECHFGVFFTAFVEERSQSPLIWENNKVVVSKILYVHPYVGTSSNLTCAYFSGWVRSTTNRTISCYFCKEGQSPEMTSEKKRPCLDRCPFLSFFGGVTWNSYSDLPREKRKNTFWKKKCVQKKGQIFEPVDGWVGERTLERIWMIFLLRNFKTKSCVFFVVTLPKTSSFAPRNRPKRNRKSSIPSIHF